MKGRTDEKPDICKTLLLGRTRLGLSYVLEALRSPRTWLQASAKFCPEHG